MNKMRSALIVFYAAIVAAQNSITVPTISPTVEQTVVATYEPTTTFPPTGTPTTSLPAPVPVRSCYTNLTEIADLVRLKNPFIRETYILCPNTIYPMGTYDTALSQVVNGFEPILTRSNSMFQCGADGKSSNNCIISGGDIHVFHEYTAFNRENKVNVVMRGITFEDANGAGIIVAAPGDITFVDCVFRVSGFGCHGFLFFHKIILSHT